MAKIRLLVDTDIIIDCLKGIKPAKELFRSEKVDIYCSILSKKELLSMPGLRESERKKIITLLSGIKVLRIDNSIQSKYMQLLKSYSSREVLFADCIIAATALAKNLPLMTRNEKHFRFIKEIKLAPVYQYKSES